MNRKSGFTLIELLIVVAIIAILAAIAVPNFLEAQIRSKIARCKADMRSMYLGAEAYRLDHSKYMPDNVPIPGSTVISADMFSWTYLTTPIAYMSSVSQSPFKEYKNKADGYTGAAPNNGYYFEYWCGSFKTPPGGVYGFYYDNNAEQTGIFWRGSSVGPDNFSDFHRTGGGFGTMDIKNKTKPYIDCLYDPTNGTVSAGDFFICNQGLLNQ